MLQQTLRLLQHFSFGWLMRNIPHVYCDVPYPEPISVSSTCREPARIWDVFV